MLLLTTTLRPTLLRDATRHIPTFSSTELRKESDTVNKENESYDGQLAINRNILNISESDDHGNQGGKHQLQNRELEDAVEFGLKAMRELLDDKEPQLYRMGLYLDKNDPANHAAAFGAPNRLSSQLSNLGFAAIEASRKIAESYPENVSRQAGFQFDSQLLKQECPLKGVPRCLPASRKYRTADGTCNNVKKPWRGASVLPMQRFLPPVYEDGIQEERLSLTGIPLPSAREISTTIHSDKNREHPTVTLMFMQWGQFIDHDLTSTVKSRSFNGSVPRCCLRGGLGFQPPELTHPSCMPIEIPSSDFFFSQFRIRCMEFTRSAPATRIDCDLGWREQINQVTSFLDGSAVYGSDVETSDSVRTFKGGNLHYGGENPSREVCTSGVLTGDCLQGGDNRLNEQPGLTAVHTIWLRYHNKIAAILSQINSHWSDEKIYQETRRLVAALIQHITYREFLPILLGQEVMDLFELKLARKGYYEGYDERVNPSISNSFSTAAFRFGHSLVPNSFVRFDVQHRPLFNNVTLHEEQANIENIWSFGSLDRILLGFSNQPSQKRDEFMADELTHRLFQSESRPFGMDLAAINIQRGRDHGLPPYTFWREPCGLKPIKTWQDLEKIISSTSVDRLKLIYEIVDDLDLFTGGLAEKPVRGGLVGPTFACIIAQQFLNLRKGDRFWYENPEQFTPAQLQQIRRVTFAQILCQTLTEFETIQPFVMLMADDLKNTRLPCSSDVVNTFDLAPWIENTNPNEIRRRSLRRKKKRTTTTKPKTALKIPVKNITSHTVIIEDKQNYNFGSSYTVDKIPDRPTYDRYTTTERDTTYLVGYVQKTTPKPIEVNIKIQYFLPSTTKKPKKKKKRPNMTKPSYNDATRPVRPSYNDMTRPQPGYNDATLTRPVRPSYDTTLTRPVRPSYNDATLPKPVRPSYNDATLPKPVRPSYNDATLTRPNYKPYPTDEIYNDRYNDRPPNYNYVIYSDDFNVHRPNVQYENNPFSTSRPYIYKRPNYQLDRLDEIYSDLYSRPRPTKHTDLPRPMYSVAHVEKVTDSDRLDFDHRNKFVKISSVRGQHLVSNPNVELYLSQRDGDLDLGEEELRLVDIQVVPDENKWFVYDATNDTMELMIVPDLNETCTDEIPRPMTVP